MKKTYVGNLREGAKVEDVFLVVSKTVASARNGSRFIKLKLADKTGTVDAVKWDATESDIGRSNENDYVLVHGGVKLYNGTPQLTLESFQRWGETVDPADFIRCSERDPQEMMSEFRDLLSQVTDPHLCSLLGSFFDDEDFSRKFTQAPAAKTVHHACIGGLLEHTLNVANTCRAFAELYPHIDKDLLLAGAALHDIGKVEEFVWSSSINYSDTGRLVGHVVGGAMMAKEAADRIAGFDPIVNMTLQHMILSHHGTREFGSPKLPKSIEAIMLHAADDLDAKVAMCADAIKESDNNGEEGLFTKKHFFLDRPVFKGIVRESRTNGDGEAQEEWDSGLFAADSDKDPFAD